MTLAPDAVPEPIAGTRDDAPAARRATRPLYWSVRRELWENRSIYLAPAAVAALVLVGLVIHGATMPSHVGTMVDVDPATPEPASVMYRFTAFVMLLAAFVIGAFYCLEALSGERRDRSILFWKSLPVSDPATVLAKAALPLVVLPLATLAAIVAMHVAMLLVSTVVVAVTGQDVSVLWREVRLLRLWGMLLYALPVVSLWLAPVYAFLLLASGWARRTAALWALLPPLALGGLEKLTMDTSYLASTAVYRLLGWYGEAFVPHLESTQVPFHPQAVITPGRFLASPGLWVGLALAAVFLAAAVRLRRYRDPG
ncbi:MAG TPA: hypothetical protein VFQ45_20455 [Longimicrobium sp.]|nr:hypothetical protein [Longimicrobium sp.]